MLPTKNIHLNSSDTFFYLSQICRCAKRCDRAIILSFFYFSSYCSALFFTAAKWVSAITFIFNCSSSSSSSKGSLTFFTDVANFMVMLMRQKQDDKYLVFYYTRTALKHLHITRKLLLVK